MTQETYIAMAHSKSKHGYTVYTCEVFPSARYGFIIDGPHITSEDTLELATERAMKKVREDWLSIGLAVPEVVQCGKVSPMDGESHMYARRHELIKGKAA